MTRNGYTQQDGEMQKSDKRGLIPDTLSGLSLMSDGVWSPTSRPLATGYVVPGRGNEGHGTDNDVPAMEMSPNQSGDIVEMNEVGTPYYDLVGPTPLYVSIIPDPIKSVTKSTRTRIIFDGMVSYTGAAFSGPDLVNVVGISRDESRTRLNLRVDTNFQTAAANQLAKYVFAVSHDGQFTLGNYIILGTAGQSYTFDGTEPLSIAILPIATQDATKQNTLILQAIVETADILDNNPTAVTNLANERRID